MLPAALRLGPTGLVVADLGRSVPFYTDALGLRVRGRDAARVELGDALTTTLVLHEDRAARPAGPHSGLYHVALLYPSRAALGRAALRLAATRTPIQGASTHATHEAIYLADPDGNGLELAADFPRDAWHSVQDEFTRGGPAPLDAADLVAGLEAPGPDVDDGLVTGHLHLHVGSIADGLAFYRDAVGLAVQAQMPTAVFASAGGYHHHLGFNVWRNRPGRPAGPVPPGVAGLREWTMVLPDAAAVTALGERVAAAGHAVRPREDGLLVQDPWGIPLAAVTG